VTKNVVVNGMSIAVTTNLADALANIQKTIMPLLEAEGTPPYIWADALCINQTDIAEKNEQVMRMGEIYSSASHVLSWLGCENDEIRLGAQTIRTIADKLQAMGVQPIPHDALVNIEDARRVETFLQNTPELCQKDTEIGPFKNRIWNAIHGVMDLTYWKRLRIL
jgi:hypothetical protein